MRSKRFCDFWNGFFDRNEIKDGVGCVGHSRLVTNGTQGADENNQPVSTDRCVGVHNGIIVNENDLWLRFPDFPRAGKVDTEFAFRFIDAKLDEGVPLLESLRELFGMIQGETNLAFFHDAENSLYLATNTGSIYYAKSASESLICFASERFSVEELRDSVSDFGVSELAGVEHLKPGQGVRIDASTLNVTSFSLSSGSDVDCVRLPKRRRIAGGIRSAERLRRCSRCVLPHTYPGIRFDASGVCNVCRENPPVDPEGVDSLLRYVEPFRKSGNEADCIVALSGGRDSCYGLHYICKEMGLKPIAYTYDWAMVTDEARKNCASICDKLGVEHIVRSADILKKRRNIRYNINAWLCRPDLGMIPLFMAGDKQFFHYASKVSEETNIPLVFFCGGNNLEITRFKTGFCGVSDKSVNTMVSLDALGAFRLALYYAKNFVLNPRYLNSSLLDTLFAFYSTYVNRRSFVYLYKYIPWDESEITRVLSETYGWRSSVDSASTWRIGDGTASFYNYIYYTVAGFSEHDTFRSNQIRAGLIDRDAALALLESENRPRYESMREYAQLVGFSLDEALSVINQIPKLY